jgi:SAM-dependent methyltransferase
MPRKALEPHYVSDTTARTLAYYEERAQEFRAGTKDHDVSQNIAALLRHIEGEPPFTILDLGCGPGRDLKKLAALGHTAIGLDGAAAFVAMAHADTGCEVWQQDFLALDLPNEHFDAIFANASLFHVPSHELPRVLKQLYAALKPAGVLFSSNPHGQNDEGWSGERYGAYHDLVGWRHYLSNAAFKELEHYYRPTGLPREQQPWLATVWRRPSTQPSPRYTPHHQSFRFAVSMLAARWLLIHTPYLP